jgi:hypothetical protein
MNLQKRASRVLTFRQKTNFMNFKAPYWAGAGIRFKTGSLKQCKKAKIKIKT